MSALGTKLRHGIDPAGHHFVSWFCPGCKFAHSIRVRLTGAEPAPSWTVRGTPEQPVFNPSYLQYYDKGKLVDDKWAPNGERVTTCHCYVGGSSGQCPGSIEFLGDSPHALAGQTVPLPPWPRCDHDWQRVGKGQDADDWRCSKCEATGL